MYCLHFRGTRIGGWCICVHLLQHTNKLRKNFCFLNFKIHDNNCFNWVNLCYYSVTVRLEEHTVAPLPLKQLATYPCAEHRKPLWNEKCAFAVIRLTPPTPIPFLIHYPLRSTNCLLSLFTGAQDIQYCLHAASAKSCLASYI